MDVRPIIKPLPGENVVAVQPTLAPEPEVSWNRRLNIHAGRTLTDSGLTTEQNERGGRLATAGQSRSPGVVTGLEAGLEQTMNQAGVTEFFVHVGTGVGIAASGEMVNLPTPLRVNALALPVYAPAELLDGDELPSEGGEAVRRLGPALGQALTQEIPLPRAGILVLQPVVAQIVGRSEQSDSCEIDTSELAFDDRQLVDGCRLLFFTWPTDLLPLPDPGPTWRNRIAYTIFEQERLAEDGFRWPWDEVGVPIGLMTLNEAMQPQFIDRYSVVRSGGKAKRRRALIRGGSPFLWHARIQQFAEEVAEASLLNLPPAQLAEQFSFLPPVGLLPRNTLSFDTQIDHFFPGNYRLSARPIPLEQIDGAVRESAPLLPLHRGEAAQVEILVPVPQIWFDPALLQQEVISPEFEETLTEFITRRTEWLGRRQQVRQIASALNRAIKGSDITFPTPDPEQLESDEQVSPGPFDPPEATYGTDTNSFNETPILTATDLNTLRDHLRTATPLREDEVAKLDELGVERFIDFLDGKVRGADDTVDLNFLRVQTDIYRLRQQVLGADEATRLATSPVLAAIAKGTSAYATRQDLESFLTNLKDIPNGPVGTPIVAGATPSAAPQPAAVPSGIGSSLSVAGSLTKLQRPSSFTETLLSSGLGNVELSSGLVKDTTGLGDILTRPGKIDINTVETDPIVVRPPTKDDISEQSQIVGVAYDFRTTTVVERSPEPPAIQTRNAAISTKYSALNEIIDIGINVDDVVVPGFQGDVSRRPIKEVKEGGLLDQILKGQHDPPIGDDRHESSFFNASVKALENTVAVLRGVEGQIKSYKAVLQRSRDTLTTLQKNANDADRRLKEIADEVAEARHDVAVARSLMAEEQKRIDNINARRQKILNEQVNFLVYRRPRVAPTVIQTPARTIDPGFTQPPITACLNRLVNTPPEIQQMVNLMRRVPVCYFINLLPLLDQIDRPQTLFQTLQAAKLSALTLQSFPPAATNVANTGFVPATFAAVNTSTISSAGQVGIMATAKLASSITNVLTTRQSIVSQLQINTAAINLADFVSSSWQNNRDRASYIVSVGDLIDGVHGKSEIARHSARKLDEITHAATCLYEAMSEVKPILRLTWAELLSQYDAPITLRNLASLPRWGEIEDVLQRREMQMLVDWLYAQVFPTLSESVELISDLVRICILLASHAPVNQIIAGAIHEPVTVRPGGQIKISVDPTFIRIGMPVFVYQNERVVAQAVVNDLAGGLAAARVTQTMQTSLQLDKGAKVQFGEIRTLVRG
ncbi:MAG: hypothetical protein U0175_25670 [Caldilineaceae bacterium]